MKIQSRIYRSITLLLYLSVSLFALSGCDMKALLASESGDATIKVVNYISPEYELHVRTGFSGMKKIQYQKDHTFWISMKEGSSYAYTDLSVMVVEKSTNRTVNSHKDNISFRPRDIGPAIIQISNPDEILFDIE